MGGRIVTPLSRSVYDGVARLEWSHLIRPREPTCRLDAKAVRRVERPRLGGAVTGVGDVDQIAP
jgi:hypothetical protein